MDIRLNIYNSDECHNTTFYQYGEDLTASDLVLSTAHHDPPLMEEYEEQILELKLVKDGKDLAAFHLTRDESLLLAKHILGLFCMPTPSLSLPSTSRQTDRE